MMELRRDIQDLLRISLISLFVLTVSTPTFTAATFNVARGKPIRADLTCGWDGRELFLNHTQKYISPSVRVVSACDNVTIHPASAMVDGKLNTWWQSTSRQRLLSKGYGQRGTAQSNITLDLLQEYEVEILTLRMQDSVRPGLIIFYKSLNATGRTPWVYRVTKAIDCNTRFSLAPRATPVILTDAVCQPYTTPAAPNNEVIVLNFAGVDKSLKEWKKARYISVEFYEMEETFNLRGNRFQHFTVSELEVQAECVCSNLSTACVLSNSTGQYECICNGNTMGKYCEKCQPFYNQFPFTKGKPCQACNCFNHSTDCYYSEATAMANISLDATGVRRGGGVCKNCLHNTAGINCEKCINKYYRPNGVSQTSPNACVPCTCNMAGVQLNQGTNLVGDCIMNNDSTVPPGKVPGDCFCKANVVGSKCNLCKPGFYNLQATNPLGCDACFCDIAGTIAGSYVCATKGVLGQCPCKEFVTSRQCNVCKDGYFGLSSNNTKSGCLPCGCDAGGSVQKNSICNKATGQCPCRPNVRGRTCNEPAFAYYIAGLHSLSEGFKPSSGVSATSLVGFKGRGYVPLSQNGKSAVRILIPSQTQLSNNFYLLLRYNAAQASKVVINTKSITNPFGRHTEDLPVCSLWCYHQVGKPQNIKSTFVSGEQITFEVTVTSNTTVNMDEAILVPVEFTDASSVLGSENAAFISNCNAFTNIIKDVTLCNKLMRTVGNFYLNGAQRCNCDPLGSYTNVSCEIFTGQCSCKPGVTGRRCNACKSEYYGLTSAGCKPCGCNSTDKVCDQKTGSCKCPPNTQGRTCAVCAEKSYNYDSVKGCTACNCDVKGSLYVQCNATTGACTCKTGVTGTKCDQCADGFAKFGPLGCSNCGCNVNGKLNDNCNKTTGQCNCKGRVQGITCDQCTPGSFNLFPNQKNGCLGCVCMGVTKSCTSTTYRINKKNIQVYESTGNGTVKFTLANEQTSLSKAIEKTTINNVPMIQTSFDAGAKGIYWMSTGTALKGNLVTSYGQALRWTVSYISADSTGKPVPDNRVIVVGRNKTSFLFRVGLVKLNNVTRLTVRLRVEDLEVNATREKFLLELSDVDKILIPAIYYSSRHVVRIGSVTLAAAESNAVGERAWTVEQCACGLGYAGSSCENCAPGYHRNGTAIPGYLSHCVGCECHKHAASCDTNTGACINCQHKTTGHHCEKCVDGYYGNPKVGTIVDCQPCPCTGPRVANSTCSLVNGSVKCSFCNPGYTGNLCDKCDKFHYGNPQVPVTGKCQKCFCNGNSLSCDPTTGNCLNCAGNTTGVQCEKCKDAFFGNASRQNCTSCGCNTQGSLSPTCNSTSGQCTCHPGVTKRVCSECLPNYYGFTESSFPGCKPCLCNKFGSLNGQCGDLGKCSCVPGIVSAASLKCDHCTPGYFGLPTQKCQPCDCNPLGATAAECDIRTGQCSCAVGKAGRTCSKCEFMYERNNSSQGCKLCGDCPKILGNVTVTLTKTANKYWNATQQIGLVQEQDALVISLQQQINNTMQALGLSNQRLGAIKSLSTHLDYNRTKIFDPLISSLASKGKSVATLCQLLENRTRSELARIEGFWKVSNESWQLAKALRNQVQTQEGLLRAQVATSFAVAAQGNITSAIIDLNFDADRNRAKLVAANITKTANEAQVYANTVQLQANNTGNLTLKVKSIGPQLDGLRAQLTKSTATLLAFGIRANVSAAIFNSTVTNKKVGEGLLLEATSLLNRTQHLVQKAQQDLQTAQNSVGETRKMLHGPVRDLTSSPLSKNPYNLLSIEDGVTKLKQQITGAQGSLSSLQSQVGLAGNIANSLTARAAGHMSAYRQVQGSGLEAVQSITLLRRIVTNVQSSQQLVAQANLTLRNAVAGLGGRTTAQLRSQAAAFKNISIAQRQAILGLANIPIALNQVINISNDTLLRANATWNNVSNDVTAFLAKVKNFSTRVGEVKLTSEITDAERVVARLRADASAAIVATKSQDPSIGVQEAKVREVQILITNATRLKSDLRLRASEFNNTLNTGMGRTLNLTKSAQEETASLQNKININLAKLTAKMKLASEAIMQLELPFRNHAGSMHVVTYSPQPSNYQLIELEFKYTSKTEGVLLYMKHNTSQQGMVLHMKDNALHCSVNDGKETVNVKSPAQLYAESWFWVSASVIMLDVPVVTLSVVKKSTGGAVSTTVRGQASQNKNVVLDSPVYLGKLPAPAPQFPVGPGEFDGCIGHVLINAQKLDVWTPLLQSASRANFCPSSGSQPNFPRRIPGVTFSGFAHLGARSPVDFRAQSKMSIKFRTFSRNAVLFTIQEAAVTSFYGIFLQNGRVVFQYGTNNDLIGLTSNKNYNNGEWYTVSVEHNSTFARLFVLPESYELTNRASDDLHIRQTSTRAPMGLPPVIYIGGILPSAPNFHGPTKIGFAGTIQNLKAAVNNSNTPTEINLTKLNVTSQAAVDYDKTFMSVKKGIGFRNNSYFEVKRIPSAVNKFQFNFLTYHATGTLMYAKHASSATPWMYVALFNGNLYVMYNQGTGSAKRPLSTSNKFLADGRNYSVGIDFSTTSPKLTVDGDVHVGGQPVTPGLIIGPVYLGGLPPNVKLPTSVPAFTSFIGGISYFAINSVPVDPFDTSHSGSNYSLSGIAGPPTVIPAPPYIVTAPPPTTPAPQCVGSPNIIYGEGADFFGRTQDHIASGLQSTPGMFKGSFIISVEFRTYVANGIILFATDNLASPNNYFCLFLRNGSLIYSMQTNSTDSNKRTKGLKLDFNYNDGKWHRLTALRVNNFMALVVPDKRDYANNKVPSALASSLNITDYIYVGGVPTTSKAFPFAVGGEDVSIGNVPWIGCLRNISVTGSASRPVFYKLNTGITPPGSRRCFNQTSPGMYLDRPNSYFQAVKSDGKKEFTVASTFQFKIRFRTTEAKGIFMVAYLSSTRFILFDIHQEKLRLVLINEKDNSPVIVNPSKHINVKVLCDNKPHELLFKFTSTTVQFNLDDGIANSVTLPGPVTPRTYAQAPIYIGGIKDLNWIFPSAVLVDINGSLFGCISLVMINNESVLVYPQGEFRGVTSGCPGP